MINTNDIESGDKVHLRDGSVLVVKRSMVRDSGRPYLYVLDGVRNFKKYDIIRIEKAPLPVVEIYLLGIKQSENGHKIMEVVGDNAPCCAHLSELYAVTITDGEATIERVK